MNSQRTGRARTGASVANVLAFMGEGFRLSRRSVRTWSFAVLAIGAGFGLYHYFAPLHVFGQSAAPKFSVPGFGVLALHVLLLGVVSLACDIHGRDARARIHDALGSRPFTNFECLAGRLLAVAATAWLALLVLAVLLIGFGVAVDGLDHRLFGEPPEPVALTTFLLLDAPPALVFWGSLVILLGAVVRYRALVAMFSVTLVVLNFVALFHTPLYLLPTFSGIAHLGLAGSEISPRAPEAGDYVQRAALLVLALGGLLLASAMTPRRDPSRFARTFGGVALLAIGCAALGVLAMVAIIKRAERDDWATAHAAAADAARPDLRRMVGNIHIRPDEGLKIAVDLHLSLTEPLDVLTFSLNPAMHIEGLRLDGKVASYSHSRGLLTVVPPRPLPSGTQAVVHIDAYGNPDHRFAYLDSAVDALDQSLMGSPLALLGERSSLNRQDYVALMPSTRWLPLPGANSDTPIRAGRPPDFHHVDLEVSLPKGWIPAGPGRTASSTPWRFRTTVPIAEFPLIAAPFERRALRVAAVECELLMHPKHIHQLDWLTGELRETAITAYLTERLAISGLEYPHTTLSVVEIPAQLRRYGGGWRMGTLQGLSGVHLLAEHGFPTARFAARYPARNPDLSVDDAQAVLLRRVDRAGPNGIPLSAGLARSLLPSLTSAMGEGAFALNYLLEALTARHVLGSHGVAPGRWMQASVPSNHMLVKAMLRVMGTATVRSAWFSYLPEAIEARSEDTSLNDLQPGRSSDAADILVYKGDLIALMVEAVAGREKVRDLLALMRERHEGETFTGDDFMGAIATVVPQLTPLIGHFLNKPSLPGFLVAPLRVARVRDDERGRPRYQISLHVRNDEPAPGLIALVWRTDIDGDARWHNSAHALVPGHTSIEIGAISEAVPLEVRLGPYLSLNRRPMQLPVPKNNHSLPIDRHAWEGVRTSTWTPEPVIVVDDLDPGFSVVASVESRTPHPIPSADVAEFRTLRSRAWQRQSSPNMAAWGKYRRTLVRKPPGDGSAQAYFDAVLPDAGRWRLSYHLPGDSLRYERNGRLIRRASLGQIQLRLLRDHDETRLTIDGGRAVAGWNDIGVFDLSEGAVQIAVSDRTTGDLIVADAIRWQKLASEPSTEEG